MPEIMGQALAIHLPPTWVCVTVDRPRCLYPLNWVLWLRPIEVHFRNQFQINSEFIGTASGYAPHQQIDCLLRNFVHCSLCDSPRFD